MIKNNFRILKKTHAYLQTILKAPVKFQKDWPKPVGGVKGTRYLLKIWNQAPREAENSVPPLFFKKAERRGTKKQQNNIIIIKAAWSLDFTIRENCLVLFDSIATDNPFAGFF